MNTKFIPMTSTFLLLWMLFSPLPGSAKDPETSIKRLTFSGNNVVNFPCLSDDGRFILYIIEIKEEEPSIKAVRILNCETGEERELFRSGERKALPPYRDIPLEVGSKPPVLSGDGRVAVFSLSLGKPANVLDHYLAVVNTDSSDFWLVRFPIDALQGKDLKSLGFESGDWERVSNYALSSDGTRVACVLKGYLGPRRYGNPSGIVFIDTAKKALRTVLSPSFSQEAWKWTGYPCSPLTGGGWAFSMSGNGERVVFGAQASQDATDYDLFLADWDRIEVNKVTDFHDRWFSLADISRDGKKIILYYNGEKKQGIGTYSVNSDGTGLEYLKSRVAPRIDYVDFSGNGQFVLFKHVYRGMVLDLFSGKEEEAFGEETPGYSSGIIPMDFPRLPAFWEPKIMSFRGDKILLVGPPQGKETPELYLLTREKK